MDKEHERRWDRMEKLVEDLRNSYFMKGFVQRLVSQLASGLTDTNVKTEDVDPFSRAPDQEFGETILQDFKKATVHRVDS